MEPVPSSGDIETCDNDNSAESWGVLHLRADIAKQAFSRADALVSIAQGYLRGDRPHRSPIEITLTIPESGLRADLAGPGEAYRRANVERPYRPDSAANGDADA
jgi:hypothetical protein